MKVLCFGSLNIDYVYSMDHIVQPGETENSSNRSINPGGKGLNQSIALARAGLTVWLAGMVGAEGKDLIDKCNQNGVNADLVRVTDGPSGHTIIQVDKDGNNSIILYGGANQCMTSDYIDQVLKAFDSGDMLILQNEINKLDEIIDKAYTRGMTIVLNPSPYNQALDKCDLTKISYFFINEIEGYQMTCCKEPDQILKTIHSKYPLANVILTLGEDGAMYYDGQTIYRQEAYKVKAVDTTAAGDTFTGYFVSSLVNAMAPQEGLVLAAKASAIAVTKPGALDSIPVLEEVIKI
ncbi:MAG: ribokinase [Eubacterium sp.]|nr:ribokinase [Eubacterium sp.]